MAVSYAKSPDANIHVENAICVAESSSGATSAEVLAGLVLRLKLQVDPGTAA